jgi:hypothetical protein
VVNTVKVILATLVIFGAGVFTGAIAIRVALIHVPLPQPTTVVAITNPPPGRGLIALSTPFSRQDFLERLTRQAALRPAQHDRIELILRESRQRTEPLAQEFGPRIRAEVQLVREQILSVLDPDQRARFDEVWRPRAGQGRGGGRGTGPGFTNTTSPSRRGE